MDWCIQPCNLANHQPIAAVNGYQEEKIHKLAGQAREVLSFDASASTDQDASKFRFKVLKDEKGKEIHLILQVSDQNAIANMTDYPRIILEVE